MMVLTDGDQLMSGLTHPASYSLALSECAIWIGLSGRLPHVARNIHDAFLILKVSQPCWEWSIIVAAGPPGARIIAGTLGRLWYRH